MNELHCKECGSSSLEQVPVDGWECSDCGYLMGPADPPLESDLSSDRWPEGAQFRVCPICEGRGAYVNPAIDSQGLSAEDFEQAGEDFREDYFAGVYDQTCAACAGKRVVAPSDLARYYGQLEDHWTMLAERGERYGDSRL